MIKALRNYQTEFTESKIYNYLREAKCLPFDYYCMYSRIRRIFTAPMSLRNRHAKDELRGC